MVILRRQVGPSIGYNKKDEIKVILARILASWGVVIGWISWDEGVPEACYRSIAAQQNLYGCS
jgi:ADP-ribose pyrophosphatase YjhB (NUDIX family)